MDTIKLDWAYYNPVSLVLKEKGLLEEEFKKDGIKIEWAQSLGSNKALELFRSKSVDFGSAAGSRCLVGPGESARRPPFLGIAGRAI